MELSRRTGVRVVRESGDNAELWGIVRLSRYKGDRDQGQESRSS